MSELSLSFISGMNERVEPLFDGSAIPVFPSRRFMEAELSIHVDSGIEGAEDLAGKRVGVGEYQQTASLWLRGTLEHGGATGFKPLAVLGGARRPRELPLGQRLLQQHGLQQPGARGTRRAHDKGRGGSESARRSGEVSAVADPRSRIACKMKAGEMRWKRPT